MEKVKFGHTSNETGQSPGDSAEGNNTVLSLGLDQVTSLQGDLLTPIRTSEILL